MIRKPTMKILNYATKFCSFLLKIGKVFIVLFDVNEKVIKLERRSTQGKEQGNAEDLESASSAR